MNEQPNAPVTPDLTALLAQGRFMFLEIANALLSADAQVAGWKPEAIAQALALKSRGDRVGLEIFAYETGIAISLVAVSPLTGRRVCLDVVTEDDAGKAN